MRLSIFAVVMKDKKNVVKPTNSYHTKNYYQLIAYFKPTYIQLILISNKHFIFKMGRKLFEKWIGRNISGYDNISLVSHSVL
jgi:hypothetical protein